MKLLPLLENFNHSEYEKITNRLYNESFKIFYDEAQKLLPTGIKSSNLAVGQEDEYNTCIIFLCESYYRMPWRPDLAFVNLWQSINFCYSKISPDIERDMDGIHAFVTELSTHPNHVEYRELEKEYAALLPKGCADFITQGVFKRDPIAGTKKFKSKIYNKVSNECPTFKNLIDTEYRANYEKAPGDTYDYKNAIYRDLGHLLAGKEQKKTHSTYKFSDFESTRFLFICLLYMHRNNLIHGRKAPLLSTFQDKDFAEKYTEACYIYFLGHFYLTVLMSVVGLITHQEVITINQQNLVTLKKILKLKLSAATSKAG